MSLAGRGAAQLSATLSASAPGEGEESLDAAHGGGEKNGIEREQGKDRKQSGVQGV